MKNEFTAIAELTAAHQVYTAWKCVERMATDAQEKRRDGFAGGDAIMIGLEEAQAWKDEALDQLAEVLDATGKSRVSTMLQIHRWTRETLENEGSALSREIRQMYHDVYGVYPRKPIKMADGRTLYIGERYDA